MHRTAGSLYLCSIRAGEAVRSLRSAGKTNVMAKERKVAFSWNSLETRPQVLKGTRLSRTLVLVQVEGLN